LLQASFSVFIGWWNLKAMFSLTLALVIHPLCSAHQMAAKLSACMLARGSWASCRTAVFPLKLPNYVPANA
jgi:hypothetical protein